MAAVSHSLAQRGDHPLALIEALAAAEKARALDPQSSEALYNDALILKEMGLRERSILAWEAYLRRDPSSEWSREARTHRAEVALHPGEHWEDVRPEAFAAARRGDRSHLRSLVASHLTPARLEVEEVLLPEWGRFLLMGDAARAADALRLSEELAAVLQDLTGDSLSAEAIAAIRRIKNEPRLRSVAAGHVEFAQGIRLVRSDDFAAAQKFFRSSRTRLEEAGSPFALRAALKIALCLHRLGAYPETRKLVEALEVAAGRSHFYVRSEALWIDGVSSLEKSDVARAGKAYQRALELFERLGDPDPLMGMHGLLGERLVTSGNFEAAWRHLHAGLALVGEAEAPKRLRFLYATAAFAAERMGEPDVALLFQDAAVRNALREGSPQAILDSYRWRARIHHRLGHPEAAVKDLDRAWQYLDKIPHAKGAGQKISRAEAGIRDVEGEILLATDPQRAVEALTESIAFCREGEYCVTLASLQLSLSRAYLALDETGLAREVLAESLETFESWRSQLNGEKERIAFQIAARGAFDDLIALELRAGRPEAAFDVSERKRARALLDRWAGLGVEPDAVAAQLLDHTALQQQLPSDRILVAYGEIGDRLGAWVVHREGIAWQDLGVDRRDVERRVELFRDEIRRRAPIDVLRRLAAELYDDLIRPLAGTLPSRGALVLVPEGVLWDLPFAALYDETQRRYLVEQRTLLLAPSANQYILAVERSRELASTAGPDGVLVVSNPAFDQVAFRDLDPLPVGSEADDLEIASLYGHAQTIAGSLATPEAFLVAVGANDIVHYHGHAVVVPDSLSDSRLLLAPEPGDPEHGALYAHQIANERFQRTRLVVLSACQTAGKSSAPTDGGEGVGGLARPFLAAGVPAVVASLWPISEGATKVTTHFHRGIAVGRGGPEALRAAQVASCRDLPMRDWAAMVMIGESYGGVVRPPG